MPATGPLRPAPLHGPIFIIGAMGSGTTLLRLMLDSHENIAIPHETGFMRAYDAHRFIPYKWSGRNWAKRMGWSHEELDAELHDFYDRIFRRYVESRGAKRWGEKTPLHTFHIDDMARLFPDSVFVCIVRHPGGGTNSNMKRFRQPLKKAVTHYRRYTREIARQAARHPERFALLRYEDLVLQPEATMRQLLEWLGEPWSPRVLEHHVVQAERGGKLKVEGRSRKDNPIDTTRLAAWADSMTPADRRYMERQLGPLGAFFGYDAGDPTVMQPLRPDGLVVTDGAEIKERVERHPELNLLEPNRPARADRFLDPREVTVRAAKPKDAQEPKPAAPAAVPRQSPLKAALLPVWRRVPRRVRQRIRPIGRRILRGRAGAQRGPQPTSR